MLGFAGATGKVTKPLLFLDLVSGDRIKVGRRVRRFSSRSLLICCTATSDVPSIFCALDVLCSFRLSWLGFEGSISGFSALALDVLEGMEKG